MAAGLRFGGEGRRSNRGGRRRRGGPNDDIISPFLAVGFIPLLVKVKGIKAFI
jgi:hypothetical protein